MKAPLLPVALALMTGIATALHTEAAATVWLWATAICATATGAAVLLVPRRPVAVLLPVLLLAVSVGGLLTTLRLEHDWTRCTDNRATMEATLRETPVPRGHSLRAKARVATGGDITLYVRNDSTAATLRYGDRLLFHGRSDTVRRSIRLTSDHYIVTARDSTSLRVRSEALRLKLLHRMQTGPLPARPRGLAEALTLGWRGGLDQSMQASFRDAGIAHLLSVSGLHVGLLATMAGWLLMWTGKERRGRIARGSVQLAAVWGFALLTGMAPATLRAALMFSLFIVADIAARRTPRLNLLAAAAIVTLVADPMLLADVGWQLSYSAVAGIVLARPVIAAFHSRLWQTATASVAATLATLPVVLAVFHRLPLYFLATNIVVVPLSGLLLLCSFLYMAWPCAATAWPLGWLAEGCGWFTSQVAALPRAVVELEPNWWSIAAVAVAVTLLLLAANRIGTITHGPRIDTREPR